MSGGYTEDGPLAHVFIDGRSKGATQWVAELTNPSSSEGADVGAIAYCAPAGSAVAASVRRSGLTPRMLKLIAAEKVGLARLRRR